MKIRYFVAGILFSQFLMPVVYTIRDLGIEYLKLLYPVILEEPMITESEKQEDNPKRIIGFSATEEDKTESETI